MGKATPTAGLAGFDPQLVQELREESARPDRAPGRQIPHADLAKHINHTPFPSQYFQTVDSLGDMFHVIALRVTYDMTVLSDNGTLAYAADQRPLAAEDRWSGKPNESCPLWESDFAPYKPKCDVLVANAVSRPPQGRLGALGAGTSRRWGCGIAMQWGDASGVRWRWVKHLAVTGPRRYTRLGLSAPESTHAVAIDWRLAAGGQIKRPAADQLDSSGQLIKPAGADRWATDERNPIGLGLDLSAGQSAPQLEVSLDKPYKGGPIEQYPPVSLTPVARSWLPRRRLAGTYDDDWLDQQWPLPPKDFDFAYWNCAPADQQIDYPDPGAQITLLNLYSAGAPVWPLTDKGRWRASLPPHDVFVHTYFTDVPGRGPDDAMALDTLVVDMAARQVCATYRWSYPVTEFARFMVMETRHSPAGSFHEAVPLDEMGPLT